MDGPPAQSLGVEAVDPDVMNKPPRKRNDAVECYALEDDPMPFLKMHEGASYREYIVEVVRRKSARSYIEVGVRDGETLALIDTACIGIDPHFVVDRDIIARKRKLFLFQMSSDEFFREYDPRVLLQSPVDAVFLDGLHQFEYL